MTLIDLSSLQTEGRNPRTTAIDQMSTQELCRLINNDDAFVVPAVAECIPTIAGAIDALAHRVRRGGRVIYVGAGTSGRLGVVDASEIPPTYSAPHGQFVALMAGGDAAMRVAQEGAEDSTDAAATDLGPLHLDPELDSLIGIAASGRTPYVLGCLAYAKKLGCVTVGIACSHPTAMETAGTVDYMIHPVTGPEVVTGSTRMKAGTATKLVLNMLSTGVMIRIGKTYGNMMVDLKASNLKLEQRSRNIIRKLSGSACPSEDAEIDALLKKCDGSVKLALATLALNSTVDAARASLDAAGGRLADVLKEKNDGPTVVNASLPPSFSDRPLVLYIDGGGTKCAAVVVSASGEIGKGESGPCNVIDVDIETSISSIKLATQRALDALSPPNINFENAVFKSIWAGFAGYDRQEVKFRIDPAISKLFNATVGTENLLVTNDIDILAYAGEDAAGVTKTGPVAVLIAGTGSVAMRYSPEGEKLVRTARSGGWGHLLGDDGGGYDLGRQAIRATLYELDELRIEKGSTALTTEDIKSLSPLCLKVLEHFNLCSPQSAGASSGYDLISAVLTNSLAISTTTTADATSTTPSSPKSKIAQVARLVLEAAASDDTLAHSIIGTGISSLIRTFKPIFRNNPCDTLVLSGSLLASENGIYRAALLQELAKEGIKFANKDGKEDIRVVKSPAISGAQVLAKKVFKKQESI